MIFISLASSLSSAQSGGRRLTIMRAMDRLASESLDIVDVSPYYEVRHRFRLGQPSFIRTVISIETELTASELVDLCQDNEYQIGRSRNYPGGSRIIDINLLSYHDEVVCNEDVTLPHPQLLENASYLIPIRDIAPDWSCALSDLKIDQLIKRAKSDWEVQRVGLA